MLLRIIGWEDLEGGNGNGVTTEDNNNADAEVGEYTRDFLEVELRQLWEGHFGRMTTMTMMTEMSMDYEHEKDVMMQLMFEMLCKVVRREMRCGHCRHCRHRKMRLAPQGHRCHCRPLAFPKC